VGGVLSDIAKAAENGGEASKRFLDALKSAHNTEIFITKQTCVAYHEDITGSVKINPDANKQHGVGGEDSSEQSPGADVGSDNGLDKHAGCGSFPGSIAANHVLEVVANDPLRPQQANDTIRARIAENQATMIAKGEVYAIDRVERIEVTLFNPDLT